MQGKMTIGDIDYTFTKTGESLLTASFYLLQALLLFSAVVYIPPQSTFQIAAGFHVAVILYCMATATKDEADD